MVYDSQVPTAIIAYAMSLWKLLAHSQVFRWCSNGGEFVTDNSNSITAFTAFDSTKKTKIVTIEMEYIFYPWWT